MVPSAIFLRIFQLLVSAKPGQILITPQVMLAVVKAVTVELLGEFNLKGHPPPDDDA